MYCQWLWFKGNLGLSVRVCNVRFLDVHVCCGSKLLPEFFSKKNKGLSDCKYHSPDTRQPEVKSANWLKRVPNLKLVIFQNPSSLTLCFPEILSCMDSLILLIHVDG